MAVRPSVRVPAEHVGTCSPGVILRVRVRVRSRRRARGKPERHRCEQSNTDQDLPHDAPPLWLPVPEAESVTRSATSPADTYRRPQTEQVQHDVTAGSLSSSRRSGGYTGGGRPEVLFDALRNSVNRRRVAAADHATLDRSRTSVPRSGGPRARAVRGRVRVLQYPRWPLPGSRT